MTARFLAVGLAFCGCVKHVEEPSGHGGADAAAYYPLAIGNRWTYELHDPRTGRATEEKVVEIVGQEDGFFKDSTGARLSVDGFGLRDEKRYLIREPLQSGTSWSNTVSVSSTEHYEVKQIGFACSVPAGAFDDCVQVTATDRIDAQKTFINEWTYARSVGLVQIRSVLKTAEREIPQMVIVLKSFQLAHGTK